MQAAGTQTQHPRAAPVGVAEDRRQATQSVAREAFKFALVVWLVVRVTLSLLGGLIIAVAPDESHDHVRRDYPHITLPEHDLYGYTIGVWNIYDVPVYTSIAENGYTGDLGWQTAYFPGYPLLIKLVSFPLMGNSLLAALLIANVCALLFFWLLYLLVRLDHGERIARRAVVWAAIFPASFFLFMGYTESLVLACMVGALYFARQGKWWLAGVISGIAGLTKQPSIFILIPLAYIFWQQWQATRGDKPLQKLAQSAWLLLCPLAAFAYTAYRYLFLSAPIQDAADLGGTQRLAFPGIPLLKAIGAIGPDNPTLAYNLMDIFFTVLTIGLVAGVVLKMQSVPYKLFAIALGLMNLCVYVPGYVFRPEANIPRRLLLIFPIFILLGMLTHKSRFFKPLAYTSAALYLILAGLFTNWIFVS